MANSTRSQDVTVRQTRAERILDVAADLLLRWGYKRVTIDDVAAHADIGKGTIYLHWKTREALFYAVLAREAVAAIDEFVATVRRDPEAALLHRMAHAYFLAIMRRPLLRAVLVADLEVLGNLAKVADRALEAQRELARTEYLRLHAEHGLVRTDLSTEELRYAVIATIGGFFFTDALSVEQDQLTLERKADLLAATLQRAFEIDVHAASVRAIAPRVIELFTGIADRLRDQLRQAYE